MTASHPLNPRGAAELRASEEFWRFSNAQASLRDAERLQRIRDGLPPRLGQYLRLTFNLEDAELAELLNSSISTLERRRREQRPLDTVASERLDRIAAVSHLAEEVFEQREAATRWLATPNQALGGAAPVLLCETEIGARQVRRVLNALQWGGVV